MNSKIKVEHVDHHRNGSGGEGFMVAIVDDPEEAERFLVIDFSYNRPPDALDSDPDCESPYGYTAVLGLAEAARGNIYMHPRDDVQGSGGNAWRGDRLGDKYRPLINAEWKRLNL